MRDQGSRDLKTSGRRFQRSLAKFKMASTSGGTRRGGRRENAGRKRSFESTKERQREWERAHKRMSLEKKIFQSWLQAKFLAGYENTSDSDFAAHLLSLEYRRR